MESTIGFEYTLNMESIFRDKFSELKSYYCREDFERALEDVKKARDDARKFRMKDLERLCRARDLKADDLIQDPSLLEQIPTREQMQNNLLQAFHDMYESFPTTTDYMERIVRKLAPEYSGDTIRTVILKKFLAGAGDHFKKFDIREIMAWGKGRLSGQEKEALHDLSGKQEKEFIISQIDDSIFSQMSVELTAADILRLIANRMVKCRTDEDISFEELELRPETSAALDGFLAANSLEGDVSSTYEKVLLIKNAFDKGITDAAEAEKQLAEFIDDLESDFRTQLRSTRRKSKTGAAGNAAELYRNDKRDARRKAAGKWELLKLCSDLAAGNFRVNGKTKKYLYYFALMFGMNMPIYDSVYEGDKNRFRNLKNHPEQIRIEEINKKYRTYGQELKDIAEGADLEELASNRYSFNRDKLYLLRRLLYGMENCCEIYEKADMEMPCEAGQIRQALKDIQEALDIKNIEKSLFQDFYNDNLLRFLEGDYADPDLASSFEKEPTGEGINYKSFVEAVYLYFICHEELDMTPGEKIDAAEAVIDDCIKLAKKAKKAGTFYKSSAAELTRVYKEERINILLNLETDQLAEYIAENYLVLSPENSGADRIMIASDENTASDLIDDIMRELDEAYPTVELFDRTGKMSDDMKEDIAFQTAFSFDWKVKSLLQEKYADDKDFLKVVDAIDERVRVQSGRYSRSQRIRMIVLLYVLAVYSDASAPLSTYIIKARMEEKGVVSVGTQLSSALSALKDIGYDIRREGDHYFLGKREYDDSEMNELLEQVSGMYLSIEKDVELMMAELLVRRMRYDKRVTRSELISIHFNYYIALLNEMDELDTFPDVFEDYDATISPILEEARFQPLSEKNILDMYVVMALYFYLVENNGYM